VCDDLEELELKSCEICFRKFTSPALKKLIIDCCETRFRTNNNQLIITAPHLASLHLNLRDTYHNGLVLLLDEMLSLVKASMYNPSDYDGKNVHDNQCKLLSSLLSNVISLELLHFHKRV
jgi:hypothetical protein